LIPCSAVSRSPALVDLWTCTRRHCAQPSGYGYDRFRRDYLLVVPNTLVCYSTILSFPLRYLVSLRYRFRLFHGWAVSVYHSYVEVFEFLWLLLEYSRVSERRILKLYDATFIIMHSSSRSCDLRVTKLATSANPYFAFHLLQLP